MGIDISATRAGTMGHRQHTTSVEPASVQKPALVLVMQVGVSAPLHTVACRQLAALLRFKEEEVLADELLQVPVLDVPLVLAGTLLFCETCTSTHRCSLLWLCSDSKVTGPEHQGYPAMEQTNLPI